VKKQYVAPALREHGDIRAITLGGNNGSTKDQFFNFDGTDPRLS
jgi:hypothetical protein